MELHELLSKTEEEVKELSLVEQMTYWQWKYEETVKRLDVLMGNTTGEPMWGYVKDTPENRELLNEKSYMGSKLRDVTYIHKMRTKYGTEENNNPEE